MTRLERWAVWTTSALTAVTGFGYTWTKYFLTTADPWAAVNHPLEPWFLRLHVVAAPAFVFAFGLIALRHVWKHISTGVRRGRRTGFVAALFVLPMVATGYLVQVVTHAGWLRSLAIAHIACGTLYALGLAAHDIALRSRGAGEGRPAIEPGRGSARSGAGGSGLHAGSEAPQGAGVDGGAGHARPPAKPDRAAPRRVG